MDTEQEQQPSQGEVVELPDSQPLSRDKILALAQGFKPKVERVEVPEWGGYTFVRELTGKQRDAFEASLMEGQGANREANMRNLRAKLVAWSACDEQGRRIFTSEDADVIGNLSAKSLTRIFSVAQELSGLTAENVKELTKSLGEDRKDDSGSD